jgi:hypothetical protein
MSDPSLFTPEQMESLLIAVGSELKVEVHIPSQSCESLNCLSETIEASCLNPDFCYFPENGGKLKL